MILVFLKTWRLTLKLDSDHTCWSPVPGWMSVAGPKMAASSLLMRSSFWRAMKLLPSAAVEGGEGVRERTMGEGDLDEA